MSKEWLIERRGYNHWRAAPNRLSHDGQGKVIGNAAGELVERIEAARREQDDATWWSGTNSRVEIALDDSRTLHIGQVTWCNHPRCVRCWHSNDRLKTQIEQRAEQFRTARCCRPAERQIR